MDSSKEKGLGNKLSDEKRECISKLRFADDVLMMASSLKQLKKMLEDFEKSTEAHGLEKHPSEIKKILTSQKANKLRVTEIAEMHVEMLFLEGKIKYLGQITFVDQETTEAQHRIRCAWSAFTKHRQELTSQSSRFQHRLHLFGAVVTPTISCGAGTWTTAKEHEKHAPHHLTQNASTHTNKKKIQKTRRTLEEETLATTKSGKRLKKKSGQLMNATKTAAIRRR